MTRKKKQMEFTPKLETLYEAPVPRGTLTADQLIELLSLQLGGDQALIDDASRLVDTWTARGDGCAVYRNEEIGHPEMGDLQFVSFGSSNAQIERAQAPTKMPDIGNRINWRYVLLGTYRKGTEE